MYRTDDAVAATGVATAAGDWLALALAIAAAVLAVGFVVITATRRRHHPEHRGHGPQPHAA